MTVQSDDGSVLLISIDHNGENAKELYRGSIYERPILHNDYLYFSLWETGFAKLKTDGSGFSIINEKSPYLPFFYDDKIYGFYNFGGDAWTLCYFTETTDLNYRTISSIQTGLYILFLMEEFTILTRAVFTHWILILYKSD